MNNNQKGVALIVGGICSFFIIPIVLQLVGLYMISYYLQGYYLIHIIALILIGFGVKFLVAAQGDIDEESETIEKTLDESQGSDLNRVIRINLTGGIIGFFSDNAQRKLTKKIRAYNSSGWRVIQVIPDESGGIFMAIMRFIILIITLLLYAPTNGYLVILEKKSE